MSRRATAILLGLLLPIAGAGCGSTPRPAASESRLTDLRNVDQLRTLFNARSAEPKLILLVSPT
jgi:hypothetical protein